MSDNHVVYLECVRPDIGKKGMKKYYWVARFGNNVTIKHGSITEKDNDGVPYKGTIIPFSFSDSRSAEGFLIGKIKEKLNPGNKTIKDTKTGKTIPKPPYKVLSDERGVLDLNMLKGRLGVLNHLVFDSV
jgi:predicted DNA-binding WGR domain protein